MAGRACAQWRALEDFKAQGGTRRLRCLTSARQLAPLARLTAGAARCEPAPCVGYHDETVIAANAQRGVHVQAWSPLGRGLLTRYQRDAPEAKQACAEVGAKYGKSAYQVALRWITQKGASFTVASQSAAHFAEDLELFGWQLAPNPNPRTRTRTPTTPT